MAKNQLENSSRWPIQVSGNIFLSIIIALTLINMYVVFLGFLSVRITL